GKDARQYMNDFQHFHDSRLTNTIGKAAGTGPCRRLGGQEATLSDFDGDSGCGADVFNSKGRRCSNRAGSGRTTARRVFEQAVVYVGWRVSRNSSVRGVRPVMKAGRIAEAIHR